MAHDLCKGNRLLHERNTATTSVLNTFHTIHKAATQAIQNPDNGRLRVTGTHETITFVSLASYRVEQTTSTRKCVYDAI